MTRNEQEKIVNDYLAYLRHIRPVGEPPRSRGEAELWLEELKRRSANNPHGDAWEEVDELIHSDPDTCWEVLLASISECHDLDLGMIGAGCLETFMWYRGVEFLDRVLAEIGSSVRFREAFGGVYLGSDFPEAEGRRINLCLVANGVSPDSVIDWWSPEPRA